MANAEADSLDLVLALAWAETGQDTNVAVKVLATEVRRLHAEVATYRALAERVQQLEANIAAYALEDARADAQAETDLYRIRGGRAR